MNVYLTALAFLTTKCVQLLLLLLVIIETKIQSQDTTVLHKEHRMTVLNYC